MPVHDFFFAHKAARTFAPTLTPTHAHPILHKAQRRARPHSHACTRVSTRSHMLILARWCTHTPSLSSLRAPQRSSPSGKQPSPNHMPSLHLLSLCTGWSCKAEQGPKCPASPLPKALFRMSPVPRSHRYIPCLLLPRENPSEGSP